MCICSSYDRFPCMVCAQHDSRTKSSIGSALTQL
jgi:hypothetical protein